MSQTRFGFTCSCTLDGLYSFVFYRFPAQICLTLGDGKGLGTLICFRKKIINQKIDIFEDQRKTVCLLHAHVRVFEFRPPHPSKARCYAVVIFCSWTSWLSCTLLVQVQLLIYFMLKYAMEILLSESSVITNHYFSWNTSAVAIFLAILGLTVLPVNAVVGTYISNMFEDRFVDFSCLL